MIYTYLFPFLTILSIKLTAKLVFPLLGGEIKITFKHYSSIPVYLW